MLCSMYVRFLSQPDPKMQRKEPFYVWMICRPDCVVRLNVKETLRLCFVLAGRATHE